MSKIRLIFNGFENLIFWRLVQNLAILNFWEESVSLPFGAFETVLSEDVDKV